MNSNELRIGNWVLYEGKPTKVDEIFIGAFKHLKAEPIELTAEVLEKAGFRHEVHDDTSFYIKGKIWLSHNDDEWFLPGIYEDMCKHFKFLHQLQNLFYCLTGEEINITLC
jgi:hypothetical protein